MRLMRIAKIVRKVPQLQVRDPSADPAAAPLPLSRFASHFPAHIPRLAPRVKMIVMGLIGGMKSIGYIVLLLFMVFYLFAIAGIMFFRDNDPWHFRDLGPFAIDIIAPRCSRALAPTPMPTDATDYCETH